MRYNIKAEPFCQVSEEKQKENLDKFVEDNERLWDKFCEMENHIPWYGTILSSLKWQVQQKGQLTDKQKSLIMSLYVQATQYPDDFVEKQKEARKTLVKLTAISCNRNTRDFILSLKTQSDKRPLSERQTKAVYKVAKKFNEQLSEIMLTEFDGWFGKAEKIFPPRQMDSLD